MYQLLKLNLGTPAVGHRILFGSPQGQTLFVTRLADIFFCVEFALTVDKKVPVDGT